MAATHPKRLLLVAASWLGAHAAQTQEQVRYPETLDRPGLIAWLRHETDIAPEQVIAVSPSAVTSLVSTYPIISPPGVHVSVRAEALTADALARGGAVSWQTSIDLDCQRRRIKVGATTGYLSRNLLGQPLPVSAGDGDWREPPQGTQIESIWRSVCERGYVRPLAQGRLAEAISADPAPAAPPAPPAPRPREAAAPRPPTPAAPTAPQPAPARRVAEVAVQVIGSPSEDEARRVSTDVVRRFPSPGAALSASVVKAEVAARTVYRGLVRGFASRAEAQAWCGRLQAGGQACFLR